MRGRAVIVLSSIIIHSQRLILPLEWPQQMQERELLDLIKLPCYVTFRTLSWAIPVNFLGQLFGLSMKCPDNVRQPQRTRVSTLSYRGPDIQYTVSARTTRLCCWPPRGAGGRRCRSGGTVQRQLGAGFGLQDRSGPTRNIADDTDVPGLCLSS